MYTVLNPKKIILRLRKKVLNIVSPRDASDEKKDTCLTYLLNSGVPDCVGLSFEDLKTKTLSFVRNMKVGEEIGVYKYSYSATQPTLYSSAYACMLRSLYGDLEQLTETEKKSWVGYFNSFQSPDDGLFRDPVVSNDIYEDSDWWGARHLVLHLLPAYTALGAKPKCKLRYLEPYYDQGYLEEWIGGRDWSQYTPGDDDFDNKVMNIGAAMQYSRDILAEHQAGQALHTLMHLLHSQVNPVTGMWGPSSLNDPVVRSRTVQFAYHLLCLFTYDDWEIEWKEKIIDNVLETQNMLGGYGVDLNSSACEDIDSIEILFRLSTSSEYRRGDIIWALKRVLPWILANMNKDGGFVFKRSAPFVYGHEEMSSGLNESNMFATWFRTLTLAYLLKHLNIPNDYIINRCPGYQFV